MKSMRGIAPAAVFLILAACRTGRPVVELGGYEFRFRGDSYRIESVTPNYMEGYNILTRRDGDEILFKALDKEQDGVLDEITVGSMSPEEANEIYSEGIREGENRGYIRKRTFAREYKTADAMTEYVLATYVLAVGDVYNRLTIVLRQSFQNPVTVLDSNADGTLDSVEKGPGTVGGYQKIYDLVLERGMRENRIEKINHQYLVRM